MEDITDKIDKDEDINDWIMDDNLVNLFFGNEQVEAMDNFIKQEVLNDDYTQGSPSAKRQKLDYSQSQSGGAEANPEIKVERPPEENFFTLELMNSKSFKGSSAVKEMTYRAKLKYPIENATLNGLSEHVEALFDNLIDETRKEYGEEGVGRVYINHPNLEKAIIVPPTYLGDLNSQIILDQIDVVLYSAGDIPADDALEINLAVVKMIKGRGRKNMTNVEADILSKRAFVKIWNSDSSCLPRAIVVGLAKMKLMEDPSDFNKKHYDRVRKKNSRAQTMEANKLVNDAKMDPNKAGTIDDIKKYEDFLQTSIVVYSSQIGNKKVYLGSSIYDRKIFLYHSITPTGEGHFDTVVKINAMMCTSYYCEACDKGFNSKNAHACKEWCKICGRSTCIEKNEKRCKDCNKMCRSYDCWVAHKKEKISNRGNMKGITIPSLCQQYWECLECGITLKRNKRDIREHECGEIQCDNCYQYFIDNNHQCYMRATSSDLEPSKFIFYDFECKQENDIHVPNFVVAQTICSNCESEGVTEHSKCNNCGVRCSMCDKYNKKEKEFERYPCENCGFRQIIFQGENTQNNFCKWLISEQNRNATVIAHNARAYDAFFIYDYLIKNGIKPEPTIFAGSKIMFMKVERGLNMRIIDSLNFLPMPLANLPKSFGLEEKKKGFFPHFFNTTENEYAILEQLPDIKYYGHDEMSVSRRSEFINWYEQNKDNHFDFQQEIKEYCISDVDILLNACWKFRKLLKEETSDKSESIHDEMLNQICNNAVDPFSFLTIASVCLGIFRSKYLVETWSVLLEDKAQRNCLHSFSCICEWNEAKKINASEELEVLVDGKWVKKCDLKIVKEKFIKSPIGLIPVNEYSNTDHYSKESLEWLSSLEKDYHERGEIIKIQNAKSPEGEMIVMYKGAKNLLRYKLDGYFEHNGMKIACEYYGCNWHGCIKCFPRDRESTINNGKSMGQRYRETITRETRLREMGFTVISKWSCDFAKDKKENTQLQNYLNTLNIESGINLRECYFGGRTNGLVLHKKFLNGEKGYYVDFTSLYPDILKNKRFPIGHPIKLNNNFLPLKDEQCLGNCCYPNCSGIHKILPYFGIIKASFLPPTNILHPVLPVRCNSKLKFPLCNKCAILENTLQCECSDEERSFTGTYCTPEVDVALNMGYELLKIHEILHWEETEMYNKETKEGGIFTQYINKFLKLKQQASGYPSNVKTEEEKDNYISNYFHHEGIQLEKDKIKKNPGLRSLSKLALNSFYGKFGQRTNMKKTKFITDLEELICLFTNPSKKIIDFHIMNENIVQVEFQQSEDFQNLSFNTNVTIAAFCTSWARLKLWDVMQRLQSRVLYHDTDSLIFSVKNNDSYIPPLGEYLGDLTNELSCKELNCTNQFCEGHWIEEFVSCGPKNYTYRVNTGEIVCKVRGFSLNHKASLIINFESMKESLYAWKNNDNMKLVTVKTELRRDKYEPKVITKVIEKRYGVVYNKRNVKDDLTTVPYGYKEIL